MEQNVYNSTSIPIDKIKKCIDMVPFFNEYIHTIDINKYEEIENIKINIYKLNIYICEIEFDININDIKLVSFYNVADDIKFKGVCLKLLLNSLLLLELLYNFKKDFKNDFKKDDVTIILEPALKNKLDYENDGLYLLYKQIGFVNDIVDRFAEKQIIYHDIFTDTVVYNGNKYNVVYVPFKQGENVNYTQLYSYIATEYFPVFFNSKMCAIIDKNFTCSNIFKNIYINNKKHINKNAPINNVSIYDGKNQLINSELSYLANHLPNKTLIFIQNKYLQNKYLQNEYHVYIDGNITTFNDSVQLFKNYEQLFGNTCYINIYSNEPYEHEFLEKLNNIIDRAIIIHGDCNHTFKNANIYKFYNEQTTNLQLQSSHTICGLVFNDISPVYVQGPVNRVGDIISNYVNLKNVCPYDIVKSIPNIDKKTNKKLTHMQGNFNEIVDKLAKKIGNVKTVPIETKLIGTVSIGTKPIKIKSKTRTKTRKNKSIKKTHFI